MLHFSGFVLATSFSGIELPELAGSGPELVPIKSRLHNGTLASVWLAVTATGSNVPEVRTLGCSSIAIANAQSVD